MPDLKRQIIRMIEALPDDVTTDQVMEELYFKLQVDAGLQELDDGKGISMEDVEPRMSRWLKK
jgi:hypothetical protein